jgi:tryptophan-rich sensory protein
MKIDYKKLFICLALPQLAGFIGSTFTIKSISSWYDLLVKPSFSPPNTLFAPVWTILYLLMGIASYIIWENKSKDAKDFMQVYWVHLVFNAVWSIIFFGYKDILLALFDICVILILVLWMVIKAYKIDKKVSYLLVPYFLWISYATVLNFYLAFFNK